MFRARRLMRRRAFARTAVVADAAPGEEQTDETAGHAPRTEPVPDTVDTLKELAELREQGILTEEEFAAEKRKLLGM